MTDGTPQDALPEKTPFPMIAAAVKKGTNTTSKLQVIVDRDLCIGAASCADIAPSTFLMDNENKAVLDIPPWDTDEKILDAAKSCPTMAIILIDTETGKQVWPA